MLLSPLLFERLGWRGVAGATPAILLWGGAVFFAACIAYQHTFGVTVAAGGAAAGGAAGVALLQVRRQEGEQAGRKGGREAGRQADLAHVHAHWLQACWVSLAHANTTTYRCSVKSVLASTLHPFFP